MDIRLVLPALLLATACSGEEEEKACETFDIDVTVVSPAGEPVADATVDVIAVVGADTQKTPCSANGDGTYACTSSVEYDQQQISAIHPMYSAVSQMLTVPETCDKPLSTTLQLGVMMGS